MSMTILIVLACVAVAVVLIIIFFIFGRGETRFTFDIGGSTPRAAGGSDTSADTNFKTRLNGLAIFSGAVVTALLAKLWSMQLLSSDSYTQQAESNRTRTISTAASRGRILDCNGVELATNRSSLTVTADSSVADDRLKCQVLGNLIGMPYMAVRRKIQDTTEGAQSTRTVAVDVSRHVVAYIKERSYLFEDVEVEQRTQRFYPQGTLAAHVLGYTGTITSDQLDSSNSDSDEGTIDYQSGDVVGQSGVEYQYESVLQGVHGEQTVYVDADGNVVDYATSVKPQSGSDIMLTLDATIQKAAEDALSSVISTVRSSTNPNCTSGSVICLDVTNGDVIAMASMPVYSPNVFVGGISTTDWDELSSDESGYPLLNRAISGQYPSASTIKPLSAFAALDADLANSSSEWDCTGYWTGFGAAYGQYCWKHSGHGWMTVQSGITFSCDVVFYEIGKAFYYSDDPEGLQETYRKWNLGSLEQIDLPNEAEGRVPDAEWKWNYFTSSSDADRSWQGGDTTNLAIGQGDLLVTPLQMACVYAGIANGGVCYKPHVLKSVQPHEGLGSLIEYKSSEIFNVDIDQANLALIRTGLEGVIYEESSSQASHWTNMSERVAGKTGTAEVSTGEPDAWFVACVPSDAPKYVVACCIEGGGYGSQSAMLVVRDVIGTIYNEPDTSTESSSTDR
jgi:penicillin-binding protein 2